MNLFDSITSFLDIIMFVLDTAPPQILTPHHKKTTLNVGEVMNLVCKSQDGRKLRWTRDGRVITVKDTSFMIINETSVNNTNIVITSMLYRHNVTVKDTGHYSCEIDSHDVKDEDRVTRHVTVVGGEAYMVYC